MNFDDPNLLGCNSHSVPQKTAIQVAQFLDECVGQIGDGFANLRFINSSFFDKPLKLRELDVLSLDQVIDAIGELPILPVGLEFSARDVVHSIISKRQERYKHITPWIRAWILDEQQYIRDLERFIRKDFTVRGVSSLDRAFPFAMESFAQLRLACAVCKEVASVREFFGSGLLLWACVEASQSRLELTVRGVTSEPIIFGKSKMNKLSTEALRIYEHRELELAPLEDLPEWMQELPYSEILRYCVLEYHAACIAKVNKAFESTHWLPHLEILNGLSQLVKNEPAYQAEHRISETETFITGKHKKIPAKYKPQGFVPKSQKSKKGKL